MQVYVFKPNKMLKVHILDSKLVHFIQDNDAPVIGFAKDLHY